VTRSLPNVCGPASDADVVIVNFRSAPLLGRTVAIARDFAGDQARVILVDNSPGDGASDVVRAAAPDATVVTNAVNRGFATAVNQAVAAGEAEIVFLLNPDVQRVSGTFADVAEVFRDPRVGAVATRLVNPDGSDQPNCFRAPRPFDLISEDLALGWRFPNWQRARRLRMREPAGRSAFPIDWGAGACLFLRRAALADVGPFDERFFVYCEEMDWLIRAKRRGWRTLYLPTVAATHAGAGSSPGARAPSSLLLLESQHRYTRKHYGAIMGGLLRATLLGIDAGRFVRHGLRARDDRRAAALGRIRVHLTLRAPHPG
jgi:GT2 family glycosyltransferase